MDDKSAEIAAYNARAEELRDLIARGELDEEGKALARQELREMVVRNDKGHCLVSMNPLGKEKGVQSRVVTLQAQMEEAIRRNTPVEDLQEVVQTMVGLAKSGDVKAGKVVMDAFVAKPRHVQEDVSSGSSKIQITINNPSAEGQPVIIEGTES